MSTHPEAVWSRNHHAAHTTVEVLIWHQVDAHCHHHRWNTVSFSQSLNMLSSPSNPPLSSHSLLTHHWHAFSCLQPLPDTFAWHSNPCLWCGALLLKTEDIGWCCHKGAKVLDPLPPLPPSLVSFAMEYPTEAGNNSCALNYLFNLSTQGVSGDIHTFNGTLFLYYT